MKKVNTTYWKVFRIEELFDVIKGKRLTKADMITGKTNYIGATAFNNGVTAKIGNSEYIHPAGTITVCYNGSIGQTFYQEEPFWATDDVNVLYPKFKLTRNIALFICPIIYKVSLNYAYEDKWTAEKMRVSKIPLPSTSDGAPDWQYIEDYMRRIEQRTQTAISAFVSSKYTPRKIDAIYWKEFKVDDLFEITKCTKKIWKINADKDGTIPIYSSESVNNGIVGYCNQEPFYIVNKEHPIYLIFGDHTRAFHIANSSFCVADNVKVLQPKNIQISVLALCFISTIWKAKIPNLGYSRHWSIAKDVKIPLPSTLSGEPDWRYMEMYMRGVEAIAREKISLLTKKKQEPIQQTNLVNYGTVNIYEK